MAVVINLFILQF